VATATSLPKAAPEMPPESTSLASCTVRERELEIPPTT